MILKVRDFIDRHSLIEKGDRILLSLSAGKDSMFLFHALHVLSREYGCDLGIFHLNHLTRGTDSYRDEDHLKRLGEMNSIPVYTRRYDFGANKLGGVSFEEQARDVRYRLAGEISAENGYNKIATGHNRNDNVETVLMRIFTGTGLHGLQGIHPERGPVIRPLVELTADEIYGYLAEHDIIWFEDSSNADTAYTRNYIRHTILPLVRRRFPSADESISSLAGLARDAEQLLEGHILEKYPDLYEVSGNTLYIETDPLISSYPLFCQAVSAGIRNFFNERINRKMLSEIYQKYLINRSNIRLYENVSMKIDKVCGPHRTRMRITTVGDEEKGQRDWAYGIDLAELGSHSLNLAEIGVRVTIETSNHDYFKKFYKNTRYVFVALEKKLKTLYIRNRRKGDKIITEGGTKKIKDLLIEKKLDHESKNRIPLLVSDSQIIAFMPGLLYDIPNRVARDFLIDKNKREVLAVYKN